MINELKSCLMCEHPKYTWFEVVCETDALFYPDKPREHLCDVHQQIASEQIQEYFNR